MKPAYSIFLIFSIFCLSVSPAFGQQGIGTGETPPHESAVLELRSTTKALLLPRLTSTQANAITDPAAGLVVYNSTNKCLSYYDGSTFNDIVASLTPSQKGSSYTAHYNGGGAGSATTVTYTSGESFSTNTTCANRLISVRGCGGYYTVTGVSGTVYNLVEINGQCWIAQNMQEVPSQFSTQPTWINSTDNGFWGNNSDGGTTANANGLLYQWSAAMNGSTTERNQGICPTGFHIPSDCEWMYLEHGLGMGVAEQQTVATRGATPAVGTKLVGPLTNFKVLFAGYRSSADGSYSGTTYGYFWSSTSGVGRRIAAGGVRRDNAYNAATAYSVRCIKD